MEHDENRSWVVFPRCVAYSPTRWNLDSYKSVRHKFANE